MAADKKILVVDDEASVGRMLRDLLSRSGHGFGAKAVASGPEALEFLSKNACDCVLLDLHMPDMDGFEVLRRLQSDPGLKYMPVIVVTGGEAAEDCEPALALGADDYIAKPFDEAILTAKVKHHIALAENERAGRSAAAPAGVIESGPIRMDGRRRKISVNGGDVPLTDKEFDLLRCLLESSPKTVPWGELHKKIWDMSDKEASSKQSEVLQVTLSRLRVKLGTAEAARIIVHKGAGMRLLPPQEL